jgi:hypothetical protein
MFPFRLFAATGHAVARLDSPDGASVQTTVVLGNEHQSREGHIVNSVTKCGTVRHHCSWPAALRPAPLWVSPATR